MYICTWHLNWSHTITARFLEQTHYQPWPICTCKIHSQQYPWIIIIAIYLSRWKVLLFSKRTWELSYGDTFKSFYTWCLAVSIAFLTWHFHSIVQQDRMHVVYHEYSQVKKHLLSHILYIIVVSPWTHNVRFSKDSKVKWTFYVTNVRIMHIGSISMYISLITLNSATKRDTLKYWINRHQNTRPVEWWKNKFYDI